MWANPFDLYFSCKYLSVNYPRMRPKGGRWRYCDEWKALLQPGKLANEITETIFIMGREITKATPDGHITPITANTHYRQWSIMWVFHLFVGSLTFSNFFLISSIRDWLLCGRSPVLVSFASCEAVVSESAEIFRVTMMVWRIHSIQGKYHNNT